MDNDPKLALDAAAGVIGHGGIILYPTRTLWGIGGDARLPGVIDKIRSVKGRGDSSPFLLLVRDIATVRELTSRLPSSALKLMAALWPGELTLLLPAADELPPELIGSTGLVGVRLATHPVPYGLIERTNAWLISTSANPSGSPPPKQLEQVAATIVNGVDAVLDFPPSPSGTQSSIVAVSADDDATLIREGAISQQVLTTVLGGALQR